MSLRFKLSSNAVRLARELRGMKAAALRNVQRALNRENQFTAAHVARTRLSQRGPETLGVLTNRYRNSLRPSQAEIIGDRVVSAIGTNVESYPRAHEFGFSGDVTVRRHDRRVFTHRTTGGGAAFNPTTGKITKQRKKKISLFNGTVTVREHVRHMEIKARAPLSRGIAEREGNYSEAISRAVVEAYNKGGA